MSGKKDVPCGVLQTGNESTRQAKNRGMKEFIVEVSGSGVIYLMARDEDDAIAKANRLSSRQMCEAIDLIEVLEIQEVDDHG